MALSNGIYDGLYIGKSLQQKVGDFSVGEIQLFSYLACLLSIYDGLSATSWGYMFIKNEFGSPYSKDIASGIEIMKSKGLLEDTDKDFYFTVSDRGTSFFNHINSHSQNEKRKKYLNAAMQMVNFFPYGVLTKAINDEPILRASRSVDLRRNLLDEDGSAQPLLYDQFKVLRKAIQGQEGLLTPAYLWLNSLAFYNPEVTYEQS